MPPLERYSNRDGHIKTILHWKKTVEDDVFCEA